MKIRNGFVSNSSSSSFICIAKPGVVQKALEKEDEVTKKVVAGYLNPKDADKITLDGNTYELYKMTISTEEFGCDCDLDGDEYEQAYDKWNDFTAKLAKIPNVIVRDEYC
jgi:hypothetical protein